MRSEIEARSLSGYPMIVILLVCQLLTVWAILMLPPLIKLIAILAAVVVLICWFGLYMVHPNQGKVLQLFGTYKGTDHTPGLRWNNPLYAKREVSMRVRNFESGRLKVNDANGNPIEIAAVVVWRVVDTFDAVFEVDDYENYVTIQSEAALRNLATSFPYEPHHDDEEDHGLSLRGDPTRIAEKLRTEVQDRLGKAGVEVLEARLSHLAYAPEIAQAMLQRQQASAILAARRLIVKGAVGMVKDAINQLADENILKLDDERKAHMVSNLLVVLCSEQNTTPVLNAGAP